MPQIGLGRWLSSWVTKGLVAIGRSFENVFSFLSGVVPGIEPSTVGNAYRAAEKELQIAPAIADMDRHALYPKDLMTEQTFHTSQRYLVEFDVAIYDIDTGEDFTETRTVYFMENMSASDYEAAYLKENTGDRYETGLEIKGAIVTNVAHNSRWTY